MGAHAYVKPRLATALRELGEPAGIAPRPLRYVGRTASASVGARRLTLARPYVRLHIALVVLCRERLPCYGSVSIANPCRKGAGFFSVLAVMDPCGE